VDEEECKLDLLDTSGNDFYSTLFEKVASSDSKRNRNWIEKIFFFSNSGLAALKPSSACIASPPLTALMQFHIILKQLKR